MSNAHISKDIKQSAGPFIASLTDEALKHAVCFVAPAFVGGTSLYDFEYKPFFLEKDGKLSKTALFCAGAGAAVEVVTIAMVFSSDPIVSYALKNTLAGQAGLAVTLMGIFFNGLGVALGYPEFMKGRFYIITSDEYLYGTAHAVRKKVEATITAPLRNGIHKITAVPAKKIKQLFRKEL
ncbi:MAG: hypothetical protein WC464_06710 [Bdellovibrionales bacterium]